MPKKAVANSRSLNKEARKRELTKITEENRHILKRIQHKEPYYNHLDWEYERKIQEGCDTALSIEQARTFHDALSRRVQLPPKHL